MASLRLPLLQRRPEVPWPAIIEALRAGGISTRRIGAAIALPHSNVDGWKRGARPNYEDGLAFLALAWQNRDLLPPELAAHCEPRSVDLPPGFRGEPRTDRRRSVDRLRRQPIDPKPHAEVTAHAVEVDEPSPWSALDSVTQLWRGTCAEPA